MPVKRRIMKTREYRITPEAIEAFRAGDCRALHRALGLRPWQPSPLPHSVTGLGVHRGDPPEEKTEWSQSWPAIQELQRALFKAAGPCPRHRE